MSIINVENLCFRYDSKGRQILNNVNLRLEEGEVMTILGPNGAGKSTLLNCIATLLEPESGSGEGHQLRSAKPCACVLLHGRELRVDGPRAHRRHV